MTNHFGDILKWIAGWSLDSLSTTVAILNVKSTGWFGGKWQEALSGGPSAPAVEAHQSSCKGQLGLPFAYKSDPLISNQGLGLLLTWEWIEVFCSQQRGFPFTSEPNPILNLQDLFLSSVDTNVSFFFHWKDFGLSTLAPEDSPVPAVVDSEALEGVKVTIYAYGHSRGQLFYCTLLLSGSLPFTQADEH